MNKEEILSKSRKENKERDVVLAIIYTLITLTVSAIHIYQLLSNSGPQ